MDGAIEDAWDQIVAACGARDRAGRRDEHGGHDGATLRLERAEEQADGPSYRQHVAAERAGKPSAPSAATAP